MDVLKPSTCGTLQSNDCFVRLYPGSGRIELEITSTVKAQFGEQIEKTILDTLKEHDIDSCRLVIEDKGALDFTIRARVETAVNRSNE